MVTSPTENLATSRQRRPSSCHHRRYPILPTNALFVHLPVVPGHVILAPPAIIAAREWTVTPWRRPLGEVPMVCVGVAADVLLGCETPVAMRACLRLGVGALVLPVKLKR